LYAILIKKTICKGSPTVSQLKIVIIYYIVYIILQNAAMIFC